jgi:tetratricopeptide (TPR) repeat protein
MDMQLKVHGGHGIEQTPETTSTLARTRSTTSPLRFFAFGMGATTPPSTDPGSIMPRTEEVDAIQTLLSDAHTSTVVLVGDVGTGKSTLAALLYERLLLMKQQGGVVPHHLVWLRLGTYTTVPDMIAAVLGSINASDLGLLLRKPEQQISTLLRALRRPQEPAFIVLDQFETLFSSATSARASGRDALSLLLKMLQTNLGDSRILLTSNHFPYDAQFMEDTWVRPYYVPQIQMAEAMALLQRRGVEGTAEELLLTWQYCTGHILALVLLSTFVHQSRIPLTTLLTAPDYQLIWNGNVSLNFIVLVCYHLTPMQYGLIRVLSLFFEPVPLQGIITIIANGNSVVLESEHVHRTFAEALAVLANLSLVQMSVDVSGVSYYGISSQLRQYIIEHYLEGIGRKPGPSSFSQPEALREAVTADYLRVAAYYQSIAQQQYPLSAQGYTSLLDVEPLLATIRYLCLANRWQAACELLFSAGLHERMVQWGGWQTLIGLYTSLLLPYGNVQRRDEGTIASHLGMLYGCLGEYEQSQTYYEMALAIQREIGDLRGEVTTLINQGETLRTCNEWQKAHANFAQALSLSQQLQAPYLQCVLLHNLGLLYQALKQYDNSLDYYHASVQLAYELSRKEKSEKMSYNWGRILTNLGMLLYAMKYPYEAMALLLAALNLRQQLHDPTISGLERFLAIIERKMGAEAYAQLCQSALNIQQQVLDYFVGPQADHSS